MADAHWDRQMAEADGVLRAASVVEQSDNKTRMEIAANLRRLSSRMKQEAREMLYGRYLLGERHDR